MAAASKFETGLEQIAAACLLSAPSIYLQAHILRFGAALFGRKHPTAQVRPDRIVVVKPDRIGDFILVTPLLRAIRRGRPDAWITVVTGHGPHLLARQCPYVDEVLVAPAARGGFRGTIGNWRDLVRFAWRDLLPLRSTEAVLARWDVDLYRGFELLAFTGALQRISYSTQVSRTKAERNRGADRLLTRALVDPPGIHDVEKNLHLATVMGLPGDDGHLEVWVPESARHAIDRSVQRQGGNTLIAICPVSAELVKDWPFDRFIAMMRAIRRPDIRFLVIGPNGCEHLDQQLRASGLTNVDSYLGRLNLLETAALLERATVVVSVDTGLMHIAAALHRPLVVVHGWPQSEPNDSHYSPARFGPWGHHAEVIRPRTASTPRPIDTVTPAEVAAAVERLIVG